MANSFLPENYQTPNGSNGYVKLTPGQTKLRILTSPLLGWEYWKDGAKGRTVKRYKFNEEHPAAAKHFWAMIVWNYTEEAIQIFSINQVSMQRQLEALYKNPDWGSPMKYDITISREGETQYDTKYTIIPSPGKPVGKDVKEAYMEAGIDLEKWMKGENPFKESQEEEGETTLDDFPDKETVKKHKKSIEEAPEEEDDETDVPQMPWE